MFLVATSPAYAYGDPSGGTLFQVLMPLLATIWGVWLILAGTIRRNLSKLLNKLRGANMTGNSAQE